MNKSLVPSLLLALLSLPGLSAGEWSRLTHYVQYSDEFRADWRAAQAFCRRNHFDLATIRSREHNKNLHSWGGWIGLHRDSEGSAWKWSKEDEDVDFFSWDADEPEPGKFCTLKYFESDAWKTVSCSNNQSFLCSDEKLVLVKQNKTWEEALEHCRSLRKSEGRHRYDLASLNSPLYHEEGLEEAREAATDQVWTGLRFLAGRWFWVGGEPYHHYRDIESCPCLTSCGVLDMTSGRFQMRDCTERRNFLCYRRP